MYFKNPAAKRVEYRAPDPSCNPYLTFAAILMAGLDGIQNKIDPGQPIDKDIYELHGDEAKKVPQVPGSLTESLSALEKDHAFLLKGNVFTKDLIETWIELKRKREVDAVRLRARTLTSSSSTTICKRCFPTPRRPGGGFFFLLWHRHRYNGGHAF
jgi:glutamine synthetase